jgi:uncharacterized NAD-dependent epimerase/dehydratase family protein
MEFYPAFVSTPEEEIALIKMYGGETVALTINTGRTGTDHGKKIAATYEASLNIPVILPLEEGVERLVPLFEKLIKKSTEHVI